MNYEQFFLKLIENANDKNLLLNPKMTPELQSIMDKYDITLHEATLFAFLLSKFIETGRSISLDEIEDNDLNIKVGNSAYLQIIKAFQGLKKKELVVADSQRNRSSILNPRISIDENIFSQIVLGTDLATLIRTQK